MNKDNLPFPECARECRCVSYFGVGECEAICPEKFADENSSRAEQVEGESDVQNLPET